MTGITTTTQHRQRPTTELNPNRPTLVSFSSLLRRMSLCLLSSHRPRFVLARAFRPSSVPDIDPLWSYEGAVGGQTRSARARSSSFYEGDDEETMACINGET